PGQTPAQVQQIILTNGSDASPFASQVIAAAPPAITATGGVVNGASFSGTGIAPGEILAVTGTSLTPVQGGATITAGGTVSTLGGGTQVLFDGVPAPLLYLTPTQVGVVAPYSIAGQSQTVVTVTAARVVSSNSVTIPVVATAPAIFTADSSGKGQAAMTNQ